MVRRDGPHVYRMEAVDARRRSLGDVDCLIVAVGSDDRGLDVLRSYAASGVRVSCAVLLESEERIRALEDGEREALRDRFDEVAPSAVRIRGAFGDPSSFIGGLTESGVIGARAGRIGVDMTLFTRPLLFWLLKYLGLTLGGPAISVYYTEPESYRYAAGTFDTYQATMGPLEVREVPGFPGRPHSSDAGNLTVLLGFDGQLAAAISDDVAPRETIVVNGFPGYFQKYKDVSLVNNERLVSGAGKLLYAPADNPFETYNLLEDIRREVPDALMTLAPLGTKPMALGGCLFAIDNDDVRVVYARPREYVSRTSWSSWQTWRYDVRLGGARGVRAGVGEGIAVVKRRRNSGNE